MSMCDKCIHDEVCGMEGNHEEAITYCADMIPKPKTGYWVNAKIGKLFPSNDFKCSECGNILDFNGVNCGRGDAKYCPNCGARMESEDKE